MLDDILTSYRKQLTSIPLWDACALVNWLEQVAFWLARVKDEDEYKMWALRFAVGLQLKAGQPVSLCMALLERHVAKQMAEGGVKR